MPLVSVPLAVLERAVPQVASNTLGDSDFDFNSYLKNGRFHQFDSCAMKHT